MNILKKLTRNYLKLNKKRTIVTIIGIILSGAMISAVATLAVSFQTFLVTVQRANLGDWEAIFQDVAYKDSKYIENNVNFKDTTIMHQLGYAKNPYSDEPYFFVEGYTKEALEQMKIELITGRFPNNSDEIVISRSFQDGHKNEPKEGDKITLEIGKRVDRNGVEVNSSFVEEDENINVVYTKEYTITGIIQRPPFEKSEDPYNGIVTLFDESMIKEDSKVDVAINSKKPAKIYEQAEGVADELGLYEPVGDSKNYKIEYNTSVLMYEGSSNKEGFMLMLYAVCGILIAVIAIGSILVIYNSFAISVSERKKQFGMLSSVGATKKQIRNSVLYEGTLLGLIGIPLGIGSGVLGIFVTLKIVNELLNPLLAELNNTSLSLVISWPALAIAAILMAITIYLSVMIPAKRASRITPIEAIRQNDDIKDIKAKKVKTPKVVRKIFGIEGDLALKNLKRSRKRYRTTVISLIISIVLFISVSGFIGYMYTGFNSLYMTANYNYMVRVQKNATIDDPNSEKEGEVIQEVLNLDGIEKASNLSSIYLNMNVPKDKLDKTLRDIIDDPNEGRSFIHDKQTDTYHIPVGVVSMDNESLNRYLKEIGLEKLGVDEAILINYLDLLRSYQVETKASSYTQQDTITIDNKQDYGDLKEEIQEQPPTNLKLAKVTDKLPFGLEGTNTYLQFMVIVNQEKLEQMSQTYRIAKEGGNIFISSNDTKLLDKQLEEMVAKYPDVTIMKNNIQEALQLETNLKIVIQIFLYGFIVLISAIGIANIFNTISTNINLRRREFANLKSIGMTDKQFRHMLDLECIFYGSKALLYGIPLGVLVCFLMNKGFGNMIQFIFKLPWSSIIISIIAVYAIVFITMLYSSSKVKKENIIDVIREDNV